MRNNSIILAVEDELSETVARKVTQYANPELKIVNCLRKNGFGYLKKKANDLNQTAKTFPVLLLTDLDNADCPMSLLSSWLNQPKHPNFVFRIAVKEVESWLLADRAGMSQFLGVRNNGIPNDTDSIFDPKRLLINIARRSRDRAIRNELVPENSSTCNQGKGYNMKLSYFVEKSWDIDAACENSRSLSRAVINLRNFQPYF